jgi:hypothetical protein
MLAMLGKSKDKKVKKKLPHILQLIKNVTSRCLRAHLPDTYLYFIAAPPAKRKWMDYSFRGTDAIADSN